MTTREEILEIRRECIDLYEKVNQVIQPHNLPATPENGTSTRILLMDAMENAQWAGDQLEAAVHEAALSEGV